MATAVSCHWWYNGLEAERHKEHQMKISLPPEIQEFVDAKIASGAYATASEVIRDAMIEFMDADEIRQKHLERIKRELQAGLDQLERGEVVDGEEAFERVRQMSRERRRKTA